MSKNLRKVLSFGAPSGLLVFVLCSIFRNSLSDFATGFCEGIAIVGIFAGLFYMIWCLKSKKSPYKFDD